MNEHYRGCMIQLTQTALWHAVIVDAHSGAIYPTKATALLREGRGVAVTRARELIDIYARTGTTGVDRAA